jgi:hypothetical protein
MLSPQCNNTCNQDKQRKIAENSEQPNRVVSASQKIEMKTLLASSTVFLTIMFSFAFGIACGYVVIVAILRAMVHNQEPAASSARAVVATTAQSH